MAAQYDIVIRCDRDYYYPVKVQTSLSNPANFTSYLPVLTIKKSVNDPDASALFKSFPWYSNLPFGSFTFKVPRATSNGWWLFSPSGSGAVSTTIVYDVSVQDASAIPNWVTLIEGGVSLLPPVTRTIP